MDEREFLEFMTYYYRQPSPRLAPVALRRYLATPCVDDPHSRIPTAYFFARIARECPDLLTEYCAGAEGRLPSHRQFVAEVVRLARAPDLLDPLRHPVRATTDLDLLWAEFCVTGDTTPVLRIIDVFERPDRVRERLERWLRRRRGLCRLFASEQRRRDAQMHLLEVGIACHVDRGVVETVKDLDCLCLLDETLGFSRARLDVVTRALPFRLSNDDLTEMATKAAAQWSLASNAEQHSPILEACRVEVGRRCGRAQLALRAVLARVAEHESERSGTRFAL